MAKLLLRELERFIHPHVPTTVLRSFQKPMTGFRHLESMGWFHSADVCGSPMGNIETFFKGGIQRPPSQESKVLAVKRKLTCSLVKCTLLDMASVNTEAQSISYLNGPSLSLLIFFLHVAVSWLWIRASRIRFQ